MKKKIELTEESIYKILSLERKEKPLVTQGRFKGYVMIGDMDGICIELDKSHGELKGKLRVLPVHMIISIDIISTAKKKEDKEKFSTYVG